MLSKPEKRSETLGVVAPTSADLGDYKSPKIDNTTHMPGDIADTPYIVVDISYRSNILPAPEWHRNFLG